MNSHATRSFVEQMNGAALAFFPIIAVVALSLSLPRFLEGIWVLSGNRAIEEIHAGVGGQDTVDDLVRSRERVLSVIDRGKYHSELSLALVIQGRGQQGGDRRTTLDRAVSESEHAVAQAPADAGAWFHLALASFTRDGANQKAVDAALSSIAVGPYETELLIPRLDILFASRSYLDRQSDDIVDSQVRVAWKRYSTHFDLVRAIRRNGAADIVRRSLTREPSMMAGFDETLADPNIR